jgi:hypothetical protein
MNKTTLVKAINFDQYLNCIFAVSEIKEAKLFSVNPKAALKKVICEHFIPLLVKIENKAMSSAFGKTNQK